ncbi:putative bifunctional tRNA threonylcarbamoyladenosine biosynthesis protein [Candidatus Anstonella stagnisolia]|nr:putative bifunctional tRNA threonylcarbamoyladenosine biosynthesis protein [Candidatus Anstonella stagnisolia]
MGLDTHVFSKGAEAKLYTTTFCSMPALEKVRNPKKYRPSSLDEKIRRSRTKVEARLLSRAKDAGVLCPLVYSTSEFSITMEKLSGKIFSGKRISHAHAKKFAQMLAALHSLHIIHGDFTPANLMDTKKGIAVIDFGLGFTSHDN